ncbi:MAG TPA: hypothetical protein VGD88_14185 [Opitutaceae bacterium]
MDLTFAADPLASLRQLYRQAYLSSLTREEGAGPSSFHSAWRDQLAQLAPIDAMELERMMTEERRRVDEARVLAELLLPQLLSTPLAPRNVVTPTSSSLRADSTPRRNPDPPTPIADPSGAATPAVADLLDAMLRQDSSRPKRNANAA